MIKTIAFTHTGGNRILRSIMLKALPAANLNLVITINIPVKKKKNNKLKLLNTQTFLFLSFPTHSAILSLAETEKPTKEPQIENKTRNSKVYSTNKTVKTSTATARTKCIYRQ